MSYMTKEIYEPGPDNDTRFATIAQILFVLIYILIIVRIFINHV
jgi:hypothetical protein